MTDAHPGQTPTVWRWGYPITKRDETRRRVHAGGLILLGALCILYLVIAVVMGSGSAAPAGTRFLVVLGVMSISIGIMGELQTRRARSTELRIDGNGVLTFIDSKHANSIDLRTCSQPAVKHRSRPSGSVWMIEAIAPSGAWHQDFANTAAHLRMAEDDVNALRAELVHWSTWASRGQARPHGPQPQSSQSASPAATPPEATPPHLVQPHLPQAGSGQPTGQGNAPGTFEWRPAIKANADKNRQNLRKISAAVIGAMVVIIIFAQAKNGLAAVLFSMFLPVMLVSVAVVLDFAFRQGRAFRLVAQGGVLTVWNGTRQGASIPLSTVQAFRVDSRTMRSSSSTTSSSSTAWFVTLTAQPSQPEIAIPGGFAVEFGRQQAIELEVSLNQLLSPV